MKCFSKKPCQMHERTSPQQPLALYVIVWVGNTLCIFIRPSRVRLCILRLCILGVCTLLSSICFLLHNLLILLQLSLELAIFRLARWLHENLALTAEIFALATPSACACRLITALRFVTFCLSDTPHI